MKKGCKGDSLTCSHINSVEDPEGSRDEGERGNWIRKHHKEIYILMHRGVVDVECEFWRVD